MEKKRNNNKIRITSPFNQVHESCEYACSIDIQSKTVTMLQRQTLYNSKFMTYSTQQPTNTKHEAYM